MRSTMTPAGARILRTASTLFYEQGIQAVGVEAIAQSARVTKKTIYDCFGSKDALIEAYLAARAERWHEAVGDVVRAAQADPRERLLAPFHALERWMRRERPRGCAFVNACAELDRPDHRVRPIAEAEKAWLIAFFETHAGEAGAPRPEQLARQLFMLHEGASVAYAIAADDTACETARAAATTLIAAALTTRRGARPS